MNLSIDEQSCENIVFIDDQNMSEEFKEEDYQNLLNDLDNSNNLSIEYNPDLDVAMVEEDHD